MIKSLHRHALLLYLIMEMHYAVDRFTSRHFISCTHRDNTGVRRHPQIGAAGVEDNFEFLRGCADANGAVVLRVGEISERDHAGSSEGRQHKDEESGMIDHG